MNKQTVELLDVSIELFKAFADPVRLRLLNLLAEGEVCVCHLHEALDLPQSTVSRHLAYLRKRGLVVGRKEGLWVDRAGIQQQLRAYGGRHNGETDRENRASLDRLERTTKDVCFLVSILQVREQVVSFYVSFPESALNASIALIVSIPRHASMDGLSLLSSSGRDH